MAITSKFTQILSEVDYSPGGDEINLDESPIISIHLTETLTGTVEIETLSGDKFLFPATAFVQGAVYEIAVKSIKYTQAGDSGKFIGGRLAAKPFQAL